MIAIRHATASDAPLVLRFIKGLAEYERLAHEVTATEEKIRDSLFGPAPGAEVVIAEVDGTPAGFALFFHNYSTFLAQPGIWLEDLFVLPDFRGHGVGRELLTYLARLALERGCGRLEWCVLDWNESAIRFYESVGAQAMADLTVYRVTGEALTRLGVFGVHS